MDEQHRINVYVELIEDEKHGKYTRVRVFQDGYLALASQGSYDLNLWYTKDGGDRFTMELKDVLISNMAVDPTQPMPPEADPAWRRNST